MKSRNKSPSEPPKHKEFFLPGYHVRKRLLFEQVNRFALPPGEDHLPVSFKISDIISFSDSKFPSHFILSPSYERLDTYSLCENVDKLYVIPLLSLHWWASTLMSLFLLSRCTFLDFLGPWTWSKPFSCFLKIRTKTQPS